MPLTWLKKMDKTEKFEMCSFMRVHIFKCVLESMHPLYLMTTNGPRNSPFYEKE